MIIDVNRHVSFFPNRLEKLKNKLKKSIAFVMPRPANVVLPGESAKRDKTKKKTIAALGATDGAFVSSLTDAQV
jgi:hypothetical protein